MPYFLGKLFKERKATIEKPSGSPINILHNLPSSFYSFYGILGPFLDALASSFHHHCKLAVKNKRLVFMRYRTTYGSCITNVKACSNFKWFPFDYITEKDTSRVSYCKINTFISSCICYQLTIL